MIQQARPRFGALLLRDVKSRCAMGQHLMDMPYYLMRLGLATLHLRCEIRSEISRSSSRN